MSSCCSLQLRAPFKAAPRAREGPAGLVLRAAGSTSRQPKAGQLLYLAMHAGFAQMPSPCARASGASRRRRTASRLLSEARSRLCRRPLPGLHRFNTVHRRTLWIGCNYSLGRIGNARCADLTSAEPVLCCRRCGHHCDDPRHKRGLAEPCTGELNGKAMQDRKRRVCKGLQPKKDGVRIRLPAPLPCGKLYK